MIKIIDTIKKYCLYILIVIYPIFVLSYASTSYVVPKEIILGILGGLAIIFWIVESIVKKSLNIKIGRFDLPVLLIAVAFLICAFFQTPNKMEAFLYPGTVTFIIGGVVIYFLVNQLDIKAKEAVSFSIMISAVLLSIFRLFAQVGALSKIPQLPAFVKDASFNPMGGNLPSIVYLIGSLAIAGLFIFKYKDPIYKLFSGVCASLIILGLIVLVKGALPEGPQSVSLPDFNTSWQVAIETIKESPFFGVGPANYLTAFNELRPVTYNSSSIWQVRFTTASDYYLTVISELGFVGIIAFGTLFMSIYKSLVKKFNLQYVPLLVVLVLFAIFPAVPTLTVLPFVLLALVSDSENKSVNLLGDSPMKSAITLATAPIIIALTVFYFVGFKIVSAEKTFANSINSLNANQAQNTYDLMTSAVARNPNVDRYRAALAQVDMALASSIASKKSVTDADKSTISQLVQQAIGEAKAAVALNPQRSGNWQVLAQIYENIMPFATGADQFAIQAYSQAVTLDPTNPNLRISLGGVYYALGRYDDAIDSFKLAVLAKPDFANAHYNLSVAYSAKKDYDNAIAEMTNVLNLVPKGSSDYTLAQNSLDDLKKQKPAATTSSTGSTTTNQTLTAPQPEPQPNIKPPITLPKEATPPATTK